MSKVILTLLLAVVTSSATAEWVEFGTTTMRDGYATAFINTDTIRRDGSMVKMWVLYNLKTPKQLEKITYQSYMGQDEFDCQKERSRTLSILLYAGKMGRGDAIDTYSTPTDWEPIAPSSMAAQLWRYACSKK